MRVVEPAEEIQAHVDAFFDGNKSAFAKSVGLSPSYVGDVLAGRRAASERLLSLFGLTRAVIRPGDAK